MCKTTKNNQAAGQNQVQGIPPNVAGGPGGGPEAPLRFDGSPEHVPALTFIVERRRTDDDFINGANTYHTNCGLQPQTIQSIGHLVDLLDATTGPLTRIRIVTHANGSDMIVPLFGQTNVQSDRHTFKKDLQSYAVGDENGLLSILSLTLGSHFHRWNRSAVMSIIRSANAALLAPFGLETSGSPGNDLEQFIYYCIDRAMANRNFVKKNNAVLSATEKAGLLKAIDALITLKTPAGAGTAPLKTYLTGLAMADLGLIPSDAYNYNDPAGSLNRFLLAGRAADAIADGFRAKLNRIKARFNENSTIDIRGCRAGDDRDYLRAVQAFFGQAGHLPNVSGPRWYQYFGRCAHTVVTTNNQINTLLTNANNRSAFIDWADRSRINLRHKTYLLDQLNENTVIFCRMQWRANFPTIPFTLPGLTAFQSMNFTDAIARLGVFFNVAAGSVPSGGPLTTVQTFLTTHLNSHFSHLLDAATEANKTSIFQGLQQLNQALSLSLVPAGSPAVSLSDVTGYQTALINHFNDNQLVPIKNFMMACRERIDDLNDPGIAYYMIHVGIPVFLFRTTETINAHVVTVANNRLVLHDSFKDIAYRQWPPVLWAEPLPATNTIATLDVETVDARRFAMMVEVPDGGTTQVATCPHPDYFDKIVTVTNTPDPF